MAIHNIANDAALDALIASQPWNSAASTTIRLAAGVYRDRIWERNINSGSNQVIIESQDKNNPAVIRGWKFGTGTNRGNFAHLPNASSNNSTFRNVTFQWLTFAPVLYTSARPQGGGSPQSTIMSDGRGQGWRTCGTSHPSGDIAGYSENGGITLLAFGSGCTNMTVQNCLIKGGANAVRVSGTNTVITQNDFEEQHEDIIKVGDFNGLEITWNRFHKFRNIPPNIGDLLGGPTRPHGDTVQFAFGSGPNCTISHNQMDDETEELHFLLIGNQDSWGENLNFRAQYNDTRQRHITFMRINNTRNGVVTHNKCSSSTPFVNGGPPRLEFLADRNPGRDFRNNYAPSMWGASGSGQSGNVQTNAQNDYPPGFIHCRRDKVASGARYAGQGGAEGIVIAPDTTRPTVTINKAASQADPVVGGSVVFAVEFSENVTGFTAADVTLSGTAGATTAVVSGTGASYTVTVSGMTTNGTVIASIAAGVAADAAGNTNLASTSTDNSVAWSQAGDTVRPTVTINKSAEQVEPVVGESVFFDVVFSEPVTGFTAADVTLSGTAGATDVSILGSGANYTVTVTGMTATGTVIASIGAGAAADAAGNTNLASTSTDNSVDWTEAASPGKPPALVAGEVDLVMVDEDQFGFTVPAGSPAEGCEIRWAYDTDATPEAPSLAKRTNLVEGVFVADSNDGSHILPIGAVRTVHVYYQGGPSSLPRSAISEVSWDVQGPTAIEAPSALGEGEWEFDPTNYPNGSGQYVGVIRFAPGSPGYEATEVWWAGVGDVPRPTVYLGQATSGYRRWRMYDAAGDFALSPGQTSPEVGVYYTTPEYPALSDRSVSDLTYTQLENPVEPNPFTTPVMIRMKGLTNATAEVDEETGDVVITFDRLPPEL